MAVLYASDGKVVGCPDYVGNAWAQFGTDCEFEDVLVKLDYVGSRQSPHEYFNLAIHESVVTVYRRRKVQCDVPKFFIKFTSNGCSSEYIYAENITGLFQFFAAAKPMIDLIIKNAEVSKLDNKI